MNYLNDTFDLYRQLFQSSWIVILSITTLIVILSLGCLIFFAVESGKVKSIIFLITFSIALSVGYHMGNMALTVPMLMLLPSFIVGGILFVFSPYYDDGKENKHTVAIPYGSGKKYVDLKAHAFVAGSTNSGKTDSVFVPIIRHIFKYGLSSVVFDYKDGELMEKVNYFFQEQRKINLELEQKGKPIIELPEVKQIYFFDPNFSHYINPIDPDYITKVEDVNNIANILFANLYPGDGKDNRFFHEAGAAAFAGVMWRFYEDFPSLCSFPYVCATIMVADVDQLIAFINQSDRAMVLASPFVKSAGNKKQLASTLSSIAAAIKKISTPDIFEVLKKNDVDLGINKPGKHTILGLVNVPQYDTNYLPVYATISSMIMSQCSKRGRDFSLWLLDEASTLKFNKLNTVLATLRTFKVLIVWGLQDKVQGALLYSNDVLKSILTNLSVKFFGRAGDIETAEYYSRVFGDIEVEEVSTSTGDGKTRKTKSKRKKKKYEPQEFKTLSPGQFFIDTNTGEKKVQLKRIKYTPVPTEQINFLSRAEIESNYDEVFEYIRGFIDRETASDDED